MSPAWPIWRQPEFLNGGGRIPQSLELKPLEPALSAGGRRSTGFILQLRGGGWPVAMDSPVDTRRPKSKPTQKRISRRALAGVGPDVGEAGLRDLLTVVTSHHPHNGPTPHSRCSRETPACRAGRSPGCCRVSRSARPAGLRPEEFTHAVQSRPECALGWLNLGSELIPAYLPT